MTRLDGMRIFLHKTSTLVGDWMLFRCDYRDKM